MTTASGKIFASGFLVLSLVLPLPGADNQIHSAGNDQFEIVGLDSRSVSYVGDLSQHVVRVAERYLDRDALQFPQRILVSLKPEDYVDFKNDYEVRIGERGFVNLDLRWEESLSLHTTCRALSEALLVRYSIFNYGDRGPERLAKWPATAIGVKTYMSLRPALGGRLFEWLDPGATPTVEDLLKRGWMNPAQDWNGFAFVLAMEQGGLERKKIRELMARSLSGENIAATLEAILQRSASPGENPSLDDWWEATLARLLRPEETYMESMETSRLWIEALSELPREGDKSPNLAQLWNEREDEALRGLIEARYEILLLRLPRVNPAYFNAARSLGALFETYLSGDKRHKYIHRLAGFLGDFEDSKVLEERVDAALTQAGGESLGE